jgi:hypothetical protein
MAYILALEQEAIAASRAGLWSHQVVKIPRLLA